MILTYQAIDTDGRRTSDIVEAPDAREGVAQLRRHGLYVTNITEAPQRATGFSLRGVLRGLSASGGAADLRLPLQSLVLFTRQMTMLLRAGSGIVPAVTAIRRQMKKPTQAAVLEKIVADLEEGVTLTNALRKHPRTFDPVYCAMVAAGEASATLTEMFKRLAVMVGKRRAIRNKIIGALAYPALLIAMSFHILLALLFFVIPRFNDMFVQLGVDPPATTKLLLRTGSLLAGYWPVLVVLAVASAIAAVVTLTGARGRQWLSDLQIRIPVVGRLRSSLIQAQVFQTMGTLLESGVGVLDTLELVRQSTRNNRFQRLFDDLEKTVTSGGNLGTAFEESVLVEPYICQAIHTGEESGSVGEAFVYSAEMLDEMNTELINTAMKLIEPMILIALGLLVGGVAVSLFLPLFDLTSAMG